MKHWGLSDEEQWNTHRSLVPLSGRENIHPTTDQWTGMGQQRGKNLFWEVIEPEIDCQREDGRTDGGHQLSDEEWWQDRGPANGNLNDE